MTFEERNYRKELYLKISGLYIQKKHKELIKESEKYLELYPKDINVRFMYSKSLRYEERYNESIENLKIILNIEPNNSHAILALFYLYYFLRMYEDALKLLPQVSQMKIMQKQSIEIMKLIMIGKCDLNNIDTNTYIYNQIKNYNMSYSLAHISEHLALNSENKTNKKIISHFNDINIKYLHDVVKYNLEEREDIKKVNSEEVLDIYYFGVSNIGFDNENVLNYIKVVVIPNTFKIISIYPTLDIEEKYTYNLEFDYNKLFKKNNKVKSYSRIDKFNQKYNINK